MMDEVVITDEAPSTKKEEGDDLEVQQISGGLEDATISSKITLTLESTANFFSIGKDAAPWGEFFTGFARPAVNKAIMHRFAHNLYHYAGNYMSVFAGFFALGLFTSPLMLMFALILVGFYVVGEYWISEKEHATPVKIKLCGTEFSGGENTPQVRKNAYKAAAGLFMFVSVIALFPMFVCAGTVTLMHAGSKVVKGEPGREEEMFIAPPIVEE